MMGSFSMRCSLIAVALMLVHGVAVEAQGPTFKLGTTPHRGRASAGRRCNRAGRRGGLPPGQGTAKEGAMTYRRSGLCQVPRVNRIRGPRSGTGWASRRV